MLFLAYCPFFAGRLALRLKLPRISLDHRAFLAFNVSSFSTKWPAQDAVFIHAMSSSPSRAGSPSAGSGTVDLTSTQVARLKRRCAITDNKSAEVTNTLPKTKPRYISLEFQRTN